MVGALIAGLVVDKYKKFEEVAKIGFAMTCLSFIVFAVVSVAFSNLVPYPLRNLNFISTLAW